MGDVDSEISHENALKNMHIDTRAIHIGSAPDGSSGAIIPPITLSTTFERGNQHIYSRSSNPNREQLESTMASLEESRHCIAYSSGMAAISAVVGLLRAGDHVICIAALYGGTFVYFNEVAAHLGISVEYVDDLADISSHVTDQTALVWLETPTNPTLQVTDIAALAEQCRQHRHRRNNLILAVDSTFSSPIICRPLSRGADIVVHSATKYLNGHADVTLGIVCTSDDQIARRLATTRNITGGVPSPFDCWLCLRGLKTLGLRVRHASAAAAKIALMLQAHKDVQFVAYPGLPDSPGHLITKEQCGGLGGGMVSFRVAAKINVERVCRATQLFRWAVSLGGVESLIEIPATALTHRSLSKQQKERVGIYDDLIRLSIGCEDTADLIHDLQQALAGAVR